MKTILLVDDEVYARDNLARALTTRGYNVHTVATGEDAVDSYEKLRQDVVLLDIQLPGIGGEEVIKQIKSINPEAKVYFITGYEGILSKDAVITLGASGILHKPISFEKIFEILENLWN